MKRSDHQHEFLKDFLLLLEFLLHVKNLKVTGGRLKDTVENQKKKFKAGLSLTMNSKHLEALAIDLNIFYSFQVLTNKKKKDLSKEEADLLNEIGVFWENLNPLNRWGGFFKGLYDPGHFERNV